ncbi:MAG: glycosyltransferase family 87 protein, partial [Planctomycetota bacterium]
MTDADDSPRLPPFKPDVTGWAVWARLGAYVAFAVMLVVVCRQYHSRLGRRLDEAAAADQRYFDALADYRVDPDDPEKRAKVERRMARVREADRTKGAIPRWSGPIRRFWSGENIYKPLRGAGISDPLTGELLPGKTKPPPRELTIGMSVEEITWRPVQMHPNMPFTVILLTPLAYLSPQVCVAAVNVLRILALIGSIFAVASVANNRRHRMDEWVMGLAVLVGAPLIISDFQHGNTNMFVLLAIAGHLWLYRKGHDFAAGAALAMAVCLKLTPALFGLYWLYQRNWKLLAGLVVSLGVAVVAVPMLAVGPARYGELTGSWLNNLILPALLKGRPFPQHVNQSLPGVFSRLLMRGNIYYNPDDVAVAKEFGYINIASLSPATARWILMGLKAAIVAI